MDRHWQIFSVKTRNNWYDRGPKFSGSRPDHRRRVVFQRSRRCQRLQLVMPPHWLGLPLGIRHCNQTTDFFTLSCCCCGYCVDAFKVGLHNRKAVFEALAAQLCSERFLRAAQNTISDFSHFSAFLFSTHNPLLLVSSQLRTESSCSLFSQFTLARARELPMNTFLRLIEVMAPELCKISRSQMQFCGRKKCDELCARGWHKKLSIVCQKRRAPLMLGRLWQKIIF